MNNMTKTSKIVSFLTTAVIITTFSACKKNIETPDDTKYLSEFHLDNFDTSDPLLKMNDLALFVDFSTCTVLGQDEAFYREMVEPLTSKTKHFWSIKGSEISEEDLSQLSVYERLRSVEEVNYAELKESADRMAMLNTESVLLTDGEYFTQTMAKGNDNNPYLVDAFKKWLLRGYDIHIISEPYVERYKGNNYNKKRFYIIFTDDRNEENIYNHIKRTVQFKKFPGVQEIHLSASHPNLFGNGNNSSKQNEVLNSKTLGYGMYEIEDWEGCDWETIEKMIVNGVDENTGKPLPNGTPVLTMAVNKNSFGCYRIDELGVRVYDINQEYMDYYQSKLDKTKAPIISLDNLSEMKNFMLVDNNTFKKKGDLGTANVLFNQQWFDPSVLMGKPNNYLKVDLVIKKVTPTFRDIQNFFEFESIVRPGDTNNSVASSINQCVNDAEVIKKMKDQIIYSIYIKSEKSK